MCQWSAWSLFEVGACLPSMCIADTTIERYNIWSTSLKPTLFALYITYCSVCKLPWKIPNYTTTDMDVLEQRECVKFEFKMSLGRISHVATTLSTVYPKKYAHGFVVLCFVVVMQSFIMHSHEVFIHIHQGCFAGAGAIIILPQCQWSKPDGYGKISQCITTTKHSKAKTECIFLGIYCTYRQTSNTRPTKSPNLNVSRLVLQLSIEAKC